MDVYQQDNGKLIRLILGKKLSIRLPENCSTGYRWTLEPLIPKNILRLEEKSLKGKVPPLPGASGIRKWVFGAAEIGKAQINLRKWRVWEGEKSIKERFNIQVEVIKGESKE